MLILNCSFYENIHKIFDTGNILKVWNPKTLFWAMLWILILIVKFLHTCSHSSYIKVWQFHRFTKKTHRKSFVLILYSIPSCLTFLCLFAHNLVIVLTLDMALSSMFQIKTSNQILCFWEYFTFENDSLFFK